MLIFLAICLTFFISHDCLKNSYGSRTNSYDSRANVVRNKKITSVWDTCHEETESSIEDPETEPALENNCK